MLASRGFSSRVLGLVAVGTRGRNTLLFAALCISFTLGGASGVAAAEPATVTVRVEGFNGVTLLPQTQVTTSTVPIPVEGGSCSGTSAGGALYDATHGNWEVKSETEGVSILGIEGVDLPPFGAGNYAYWALWVNNGFATSGACSEELAQHADVVFVGQCFALGAECPTSTTAPDHFLTSTPPSSSVVGVGEPVSVTIGSLGTATGIQEALPPGVTVTGLATPSNPSAQGVATLSFPSAGTYTLQARASDSVPSDPYTVCVHNGNDGNCGTQTPSSSAPASGPSTTGIAGSVTRYTGPYALVAGAAGLVDGRVYGHGRAPRLLSGKILAHNAVSSVSLELRREYRRHCYAYDGASERFRSARCGHGSFFRVSTNDTFSYLLPETLRRGRYVLDIQASDVAGNRTTLARGTSRLVFYVR
jgi:hypothetical protein